MSEPASDRVVPAGTAVVAEDDRVLMHTPRFAEMLGRAGDDLCGHALPPLLRPMFDAGFSLRDPPAAVHGRTSDGRSITLVVERLPGGRRCLSAADVTGAAAASDALRRARRVAESASSAKSRVLATISHELRTPLNLVIGFADALTQTQPGGQPIAAERVREYADTIREAGLLLLRQIDNILDVVRLESGGIELAGDVIEVPRLIEAAVRQSEPAARLARVALAARPASARPRLRGDERRLRQVLGHLLANALKFTPRDGSVAVETALAEDGDLLLLVRDSGIGIAEAELDRVFNVFAGDAADAPHRPPGVGFGLYFCRAILEAHGGRLTLASRPGAGTTVTLRLPRERLIEPTAAFGQLQETP
jgi:signal transduction histidine kinase